MRSYRFLDRIFLMLLCLFILSCKSGERLEGRYEARNSSSDPDSAIVLELKAEGKGSWSKNHENVDFRWEIRENKLWLHTNAGGVITGAIKPNNIIEINLPGVGSFQLVKISP